MRAAVRRRATRSGARKARSIKAREKASSCIARRDLADQNGIGLALMGRRTARPEMRDHRRHHPRRCEANPMRNLNHSVAVLIGALALTGCSRNPVAPQADVPTDPSATLGRGIQTDEPPAPQGGEAGAVGTRRRCSRRVWSSCSSADFLPEVSGRKRILLPFPPCPRIFGGCSRSIRRSCGRCVNVTRRPSRHSCVHFFRG